MGENGTFNNSINSLNINGTTTRVITSRCTASDGRISEVGIFYFSIGSVNVDGSTPIYSRGINEIGTFNYSVFTFNVNGSTFRARSVNFTFIKL